MDVGGRRAAAAADDVEPAELRPLAQLRRHGLRRLREAGREKRVRETGVRMHADIQRRDLSQLLDQRAQFFRAERAVHADAQQRDVRNRVPERLDRLAGHAAVAAGLDERDRGQQRNLNFEL